MGSIALDLSVVEADGVRRRSEGARKTAPQGKTINEKSEVDQARPFPRDRTARRQS